jgi:hypothetical protein
VKTPYLFINTGAGALAFGLLLVLEGKARCSLRETRPVVFFFLAETALVGISISRLPIEWISFLRLCITAAHTRRFPMPLSFYKKYNLPEPEPMSFAEFLPIAARAVATTEMGELRPVAPGGVRVMPSGQPVRSRSPEETPAISSE